MPLGALRLVHAPVNGADLRLVGFRLNLFNDALAEQGNLLFGFRHQRGQAAANGGAMGQARKAQSRAQTLIELEQLVQGAVAEGARGDGDHGQQ